VLDEIGDGLAEGGGVLLAQVDLVAGTVEAEGDGFGGLPAVQVVDQGDGLLLRHLHSSR
jgi:hypothetical protein